MGRFLFYSLPLRGHLDWGGMLGTAAELARRGHEVRWASGPEVAGAVREAGVAFSAMAQAGWEAQAALPAELDEAARQALRRQRALDAWLHEERVSKAAAELVGLCREWQPDLVVTEPYGAAAALAAEAAGARLAVCGRPAVGREGGTAREAGERVASQEETQATEAGERVAALCRRMGVAGRYWQREAGLIRSDLLHVDYFSRAWYADLAEVGRQTRFVGSAGGGAQPGFAREPGTEPQASLAALGSPGEPGEAPVVLITLGSLFNVDPRFFEVAAEAAFLEGGRPVVVIGEPEGAAGGERWRLPAGTEVWGWVDFEAVLPGVAAVVHHGGVGTTHAALRHGRPQVAVPHAGDQQVQAGRITQAGVGYGVRPADFGLASARWLVRQLLGDGELRGRAASWAVALGMLGGVPAAASALEGAAAG